MLRIENTLLQEMIGSAESTPEECCGFLLGHETDGNRILTKTLPAKNVAHGDRRRVFEIAPLDYLSAERFAAQNNLDLLGIYHSHPNSPAIPSERDRLPAQPYFSYVILSVVNNNFKDIRSWRLDEDFQFAEEKIFNGVIHKSVK